MDTKTYGKYMIPILMCWVLLCFSQVIASDLNFEEHSDGQAYNTNRKLEFPSEGNMIAQNSLKAKDFRPAVNLRSADLNVTQNRRTALGGSQLGIQARPLKTEITVKGKNDRITRRFSVARNSGLKVATIQYSSSIGNGLIQKRGTKIVRNTLKANPRLFKDYLQFQEALYEELKSKRRKLSSLGLSSKILDSDIPPSRTGPKSFGVVPQNPNDIECKENSAGKCICDCDHGWNPIGLGFCLGFALGCGGDLVEFKCEASSEECDI